MPGTHGGGCGCKPEAEFAVGEFLFGYIDREGVLGVNEQVRDVVYYVYYERSQQARARSCMAVASANELVHAASQAPT